MWGHSLQPLWSAIKMEGERSSLSKITICFIYVTFSRLQEEPPSSHAAWQLCSFRARKYGVQAQTRCHLVPKGGAASHDGSVSLGLMTWYQLLFAWCVQPPPSKAWLSPSPKCCGLKWPIESMMALQVGILLAADWICNYEESRSILLSTFVHTLIKRTCPRAQKESFSSHSSLQLRSSVARK